MYQAVFYDREERQYYLRDDRWDGFKTIQHWPTYYVDDPDGEFTTLEGNTVSPVKKMDNWKDPKYYEKDIDKDTRLLVDYYYESDETPKFHNIVFLDIECEIAGTLTPENIRNPKGKITSIALYDNNSKKYYCLILDEKQIMSPKSHDYKEIIPYINEKDLLNGFLELWIKLDPTISSGWNSAFFDMPYLYFRMKQILGEETASYLSPINKIIYNEYNSDDPLTIGGINHLDYMLLFKKFITKQEPSYRLNDVGLKYVKLGKIDYEGSLDRLFVENIDKFIDYNLRDVEIIVELEKVQKYIELTINICHLCHTQYNTIYYSTILNDGAILTYLKRKGIISPNKPTTYNPSLRDISVKKAKFEYERGNISKDEYDEIILLAEYAGGYLLEPKPGLYRWIIDDDYSSLYPSIIRSLNLGIETYVGRILDRTKKEDCWWGLEDLKNMDPERIVNIENKKEKQTSIKVKELINIIEENKFTIAASGAMFRTDKPSIVCKILSDWFAKRQEYKKLMKKSYKSGDKNLGDFYNSRQHSFKILLNSVYGCYAINSWRYTDGRKILSSAITLTGQRMIKETIKKANELVEELLK